MSEENKLNFGDKKFIATALNCSQQAVDLILKGSRGKMETELQQLAKEAIKLREHQNRELERFCKSRRMEFKKVKVSK